MPTATVTSKGQITLPKEVREHLHLAEGTRVDFVIESGGDVHLRPVVGSVKALFEIAGRKGRKAQTVEEMDEAIGRHLAEDDERIRTDKG
jgi:AbrB family looped-hinge helix DNA binding protein